MNKSGSDESQSKFCSIDDPAWPFNPVVAPTLSWATQQADAWQHTLDELAEEVRVLLASLDGELQRLLQRDNRLRAPAQRSTSTGSTASRLSTDTSFAVRLRASLPPEPIRRFQSDRAGQDLSRAFNPHTEFVELQHEVDELLHSMELQKLWQDCIAHAKMEAKRMIDCSEAPAERGSRLRSDAPAFVPGKTVGAGGSLGAGAPLVYRNLQYQVASGELAYLSPRAHEMVLCAQRKAVGHHADMQCVRASNSTAMTHD